MSVEVQTSTLSMSEPLSPLKITPPVMHRIWFNIAVGRSGVKSWYNIIREANTMFGKTGWRGQPHVKRRLDNNWKKETIRVWFEVPDPTFGTWCSLKYAVMLTETNNK